MHMPPFIKGKQKFHLAIVSLFLLAACHHGLRMGPGLSVLTLATQKTAKIDVELFVMSKCPFGIEAEKALIPFLDTFNDQVNFRLFFIAQPAEEFLKDAAEEKKVQEKQMDSPSIPAEEEGQCRGDPLYDGGKFVSLHGQAEVQEDIRQVVIMKYYPEKFLDYLVYRAENYETDDWESAAARAWLNIDHIRKISQSAEGEHLFEGNIKRAQKLHIGASPTLLVNNQRHTGPINSFSLGRTLCSNISRHQYCKNVPVCGQDMDCKAAGKVGLCSNPDSPQAQCTFADPVSINLQVIDTPHPVEEQITRMILICELLFPRIAVERLAWDTPTAQELIEKYEMETLPAFIFNREVAQALRYIRFKDNLIVKGDDYLLNPQSFSQVYFLNRQEKRGQLEFFAQGLNKLDNQIIQQIQDTALLKESLLKIHFLAKMEKETGQPPILSLSTAADQPNALILQQAPRITFKSRMGLPEIRENIRQLCIANDEPGRYWDYLACRTEQITGQKGQKLGRQGDDWKMCAQTAGLQNQMVETCSMSEKGARLLSADIALAEELQINASPGFLIHNKWLIKGNALNQVKELLEK